MSELKIEEIVVGEGDEVKDGDWVSVHYTERSLIRASTAANRLSFPWAAAW